MSCDADILEERKSGWTDYERAKWKGELRPHLSEGKKYKRMKFSAILVSVFEVSGTRR